MFATSVIMGPQSPLVEGGIGGSGFDAADDWIAEHASPSAIVVTSDILLAERCVKSGATVLAPNGRPFDMASIGQAVAQRALMADLRAMGEVSGGPPPFSKRSEEHTSELQSLMRISYAVFCLKKKKHNNKNKAK